MPEYRQNLINMRKAYPDNPEISENIKITRDRKAIRLLGAFIGNNINHTSIWTLTIEAVVKDLKH